MCEQEDFMQVVSFMKAELSKEEFEYFLVQCWHIWNQWNLVSHGSKLQDPSLVNRRTRDYLKENKEAQTQLAITGPNEVTRSWQPPSGLMYKLLVHFNTDVGAVIHNEKREVMVALSTKGAIANDNEEAKVLACRKALEFVVDAGFSYLFFGLNH